VKEISLPMHTELDEQIKFITDSVLEFFLKNLGVKMWYINKMINKQ
jgi:hypothetical protein